MVSETAKTAVARVMPYPASDWMLDRVVTAVLDQPTIPTRFLGTVIDDGEVWLDVKYIAEFARDAKGLCAFCHGDPCAESSPPDSLIARELEAATWRGACPCCEGRPS